MWIFLIILFILSYFHMVINLSLFAKKRYVLIFCFFIAIISFAMFPFSVQLSFKILNQILNDFNVLSLACTYQIVESIVFMILSLLLIRAHYKKRAVMISRIAPLLPSGVFFVGIFLGETYLFNVIDNMQFHSLGLLFSALIAAVLLMSAIALRKLLLNWEWRMELKIILSFFQIILAMFLPLLLMGIKIRGTQLQVDFRTTTISLTGMVFIVVTGFYYQLLKKRRGNL